MTLYRNTDERFGDTDVTFDIDEAILEMKPTLKQWAQELVDSGDCDYDDLDQAYSDLVADFVEQCEPVD